MKTAGRFYIEFFMNNEWGKNFCRAWHRTRVFGIRHRRSTNWTTRTRKPGTFRRNEFSKAWQQSRNNKWLVYSDSLIRVQRLKWHENHREEFIKFTLFLFYFYFLLIINFILIVLPGSSAEKHHEKLRKILYIYIYRVVVIKVTLFELA